MVVSLISITQELISQLPHVSFPHVLTPLEVLIFSVGTLNNNFWRILLKAENLDWVASFTETTVWLSRFPEVRREVRRSHGWIFQIVSRGFLTLCFYSFFTIFTQGTFTEPKLDIVSIFLICCTRFIKVDIFCVSYLDFVLSILKPRLHCSISMYACIFPLRW